MSLGESINTPENRNVTGGDACQNRATTGRYVPGMSGNPGGRPRDEQRIADLARSHGPAALERLVQLKDSKDERVALSACVALLDRGYGKPKQAQELTGPGGSALPFLKVTRVIVDPESRNDSSEGRAS